MTAILTTALLWVGAIVLGTIAWRRGEGVFAAGLRRALGFAVFLLPRMVIGILGAGFLARVLPGELVSELLGPSSGSLGIAIASALGLATPAGPFVSFAIGASALKSGAGLPQVVAYVTAWSVFSLQRFLVWELPLVGARFSADRLLVSWPIPLATGHLALLFAA